MAAKPGCALVEGGLAEPEDEEDELPALARKLRFFWLSSIAEASEALPSTSFFLSGDTELELELDPEADRCLQYIA